VWKIITHKKARPMAPACNPSTWKAEAGRSSVQNQARCWWLTPVILITQAEIKRILVQSQPGQAVYETLSQKNPSQQNG
jgi:hypothetical protein